MRYNQGPFTKLRLDRGQDKVMVEFIYDSSSQLLRFNYLGISASWTVLVMPYGVSFPTVLGADGRFPASSIIRRDFPRHNALIIKSSQINGHACTEIMVHVHPRSSSLAKFHNASALQEACPTSRNVEEPSRFCMKSCGLADPSRQTIWHEPRGPRT